LERTLLAPLPEPGAAPAPTDKLPRAAIEDFVFRHGVPDRPHLRSLMWKLLLGYLPWDRSQWRSSLARSRASYAEFVAEVTVDPYAEATVDPLTGARVAEAPAPTVVAAGPAAAAAAAASTAAPAPGGITRPVRVPLKQTVVTGDDPLSGLAGPSSLSSSSSSASAAAGSGSGSGASSGPGSGKKNDWAQYFADEEIRAEIEKDVKRTYSALHFFQLPAHPDDKEAVVRRITQEALAEAATKRERALRVRAAAGGAAAAGAGAGGSTDLFSDTVSTQAADVLYAKSSKKRNSLSTGVVEVTASTDKGPDCHHDLLRRLLFLYAKLNPGIRYVQGMNEILAPIYYVFANDPDPFSRGLGRSTAAERAAAAAAEATGAAPLPRIYSDAEADAFFVFTNVMAEVRDRFIKSLDHSDSGVLAVVERLNKRVRAVDPDLWAHLDKCGVDPRFYSFRWLTLLVSQEFELPEVLRIWDSFFADGERFDFHVYFCCAMLVCVRDTVLAGEFSDILHVLQQYPVTDVQHVLAVAHDLKECAVRGVRSRFTGLTRAQALVRSVQESKFTQFFKASIASFNNNGDGK
jgi:hypothetical protein